MVYLDQNKFLVQLAKLYESNEAKGSVTLTIKRVNDRDLNKSRPKDQKLEIDESDSPIPHLFIRAVADKKKLSTSIPPSEVLHFQSLFSSIITSHMSGLKKIKKKKLK